MERESKQMEREKLDHLETIHLLNSALKVTRQMWMRGTVFTGSVTKVRAVF